MKKTRLLAGILTTVLSCTSYAGGMSIDTCTNCLGLFNGINLFGQVGVNNAHLNVNGLDYNNTRPSIYVPDYGSAMGFNLSAGVGAGWYVQLGYSPTVIGIEGYYNWLNGSVTNEHVTFSWWPPRKIIKAKLALDNEWYVGGSVGQSYKNIRAYVGAGYMQVKLKNKGYTDGSSPVCGSNKYFACNSPSLQGLRANIGVETLFQTFLSVTLEVNYTITNNGSVVDYLYSPNSKKVLDSSLARLNYLGALIRLGYRWN